MNGDLEVDRRRLPERGAREKHSRKKEQQDAEAVTLYRLCLPEPSFLKARDRNSLVPWAWVRVQ